TRRIAVRGRSERAGSGVCRSLRQARAEPRLRQHTVDRGRALRDPGTVRLQPLAARRLARDLAVPLPLPVRVHGLLPDLEALRALRRPDARPGGQGAGPGSRSGADPMRPTAVDLRAPAPDAPPVEQVLAFDMVKRSVWLVPVVIGA